MVFGSSTNQGRFTTEGGGTFGLNGSMLNGTDITLYPLTLISFYSIDPDS
jgi:hypothetical protein